MWLEDNDTFDLEADELQYAMKKWERKYAVKPIIDRKDKRTKTEIK